MRALGTAILVLAAATMLVGFGGCIKPCTDDICYRAGGAMWTATFDGSMNKSRVASIFVTLGLETDTNATYQVWARNDSVTYVAEQRPRAALDDPLTWTLQGRFGDGEDFLTRGGADRAAQDALRSSGAWFNQTLERFENELQTQHVSVEWIAPVDEP
jgi:hypothetical protein